MGVPTYADHQYNIINLAFYVPSRSSENNGLFDAVKVWTNPSAYMSSTFRAQVAGVSSPTDTQFRTAVKSVFSFICHHPFNNIYTQF